MADQNNAPERLTDDAIRSYAKEHGIYVRENASYPDIRNGGWIHPFTLTISNKELRAMFADIARVDRADPEGQVQRAAHRILELYDEAMRGLLDPGAHDSHPDSDEMAELRRIVGAPSHIWTPAALTPPPAAPTDNTALVEALIHLRGLYDCADVVDAALASREAPPVAQEPVAWRCKDYADDWIIYRNKSDADQYQAVTGCLMQPLYAAPPPACQQKAAGVAEAAQVLLAARDALKLRITDHGIPYYLSREEEQLSLLDPIALRALKGEQ